MDAKTDPDLGDRRLALVEVQFSESYPGGPRSWTRIPAEAGLPLEYSLQTTIPLGDGEAILRGDPGATVVGILEFQKARNVRLQSILEEIRASRGLNLPEEFAREIQRLGKFYFGVSEPKDPDEHAATLVENIQLTSVHNDRDADALSRMHGGYSEDGLVGFLTGTSESARARASLLVGLWNYYFDLTAGASPGFWPE